MGNTPQICDAAGVWQDVVACAAETHVCIAGACVTPPSCGELPATCGIGGNESCCAITVVPGGTYNRGNNPMFPATVSGFRLDRFEVTVGRFRAFLDTGNGTGKTPPAMDAGAHPSIDKSGWDDAWNAFLTANPTELRAAVKCDPDYETWIDTAVEANENLPMNCVTWYEAFAFCAWDGGRLPTEAEWNYAAAAGKEQREYPWGATLPDQTYAIYNCTADGLAGCASTDILNVGSRSPKGDGEWNQADLAGSIREWNLDWFFNPYPYPAPQGCNDCANLVTGTGRVVRGGSWGGDSTNVTSYARGPMAPTDRSGTIGIRCARSL